jgi:hypothetical protein
LLIFLPPGDESHVLDGTLVLDVVVLKFTDWRRKADMSFHTVGEI